jgi:hypothetical protein
VDATSAVNQRAVRQVHEHVDHIIIAEELHSMHTNPSSFALTLVFPCLLATFGCAASAPVCPEPTTPAATPTAAPAPTEDELMTVLEGPFADLDAAFAARMSIDPSCGHPPSTLEVTPSDSSPDAALRQAVSIAFSSEEACELERVCTFALETSEGWWVPPADEDGACEAMVGPTTWIAVVTDDVERVADDTVSIRRVMARRVMYSDEGPSGARVDSFADGVWTTSRSCRAVPRGAPVCGPVTSTATVDLEEVSDALDR